MKSDKMDILKDMWEDGAPGKVLLGLIAVCMVSLAVFTVQGVFRVVDRAWGITSIERAVVDGHEFSPGTTIPVMHSTGKISWVQVIHRAAEYRLVIRTRDGRTGAFSVPKPVYDAIKDGEETEIGYKNGLFSQRICVVSINAAVQAHEEE